MLRHHHGGLRVRGEARTGQRCVGVCVRVYRVCRGAHGGGRGREGRVVRLAGSGEK